VREHPDICNAVEAMLGEVTCAQVRQQCEHGDRPQCRFVLSAATG
jgi:hypothetical protein